MNVRWQRPRQSRIMILFNSNKQVNKFTIGNQDQNPKTSKRSERVRRSATGLRETKPETGDIHVCVVNVRALYLDVCVCGSPGVALVRWRILGILHELTRYYMKVPHQSIFREPRQGIN